jgi:hypothetical protein
MESGKALVKIFEKAGLDYIFSSLGMASGINLR